METTYKIIGGDGREYGPVPLEELANWVRQGRVLPQTQVWSSASELWQPAGQWPELSSVILQVTGGSPPPLPDATAPVASPWLRLAAFLVDTFIASTITQILWHFVATMGNLDPKPPTLNADMESLQTYMKQMLPQMLMFHSFRMILEVGFTGTFGATIGKLVTGLKVVRLDGSPVGYSIAFLRFVGKFACEIPLYLGYLPVLVRGDRRGAHDLVCGTRVVQVRSSQTSAVDSRFSS